MKKVAFLVPVPMHMQNLYVFFLASIFFLLDKHFFFFLYTAVVVVVVLTLTRIIKSVVTGQAPVTLELRNTPGKNTAVVRLVVVLLLLLIIWT